MDRPVGLNWGCGPVAADEWVNVDIAWQDVVGHVYGSTRGFADATFDGIVANHSLQCIEGALLDDVVQEFHRLLRPGGRLRVLVPDVLRAFYAYDDGDATWSGFVAITEEWTLDRKFAHYLTWGGQNRTVFTTHSLLELMQRNGFELSSDWWNRQHVSDAADHDWAWLRELDSRLDESIEMEVVAE